MKVAVLSGKGGAGKTFVAVNLAVTAGKSTYIDCDVEEPNGWLFLKPQDVETQVVSTKIPAFDPDKCTGCRKCVDFCQFNALIYIKEKPKVFNEVCHACGGCLLVCPENAITEIHRPVGHLEIGQSGTVKAVTGVLNTGEASGVGVIKAALKHSEGFTVIDCPPGSACSVMESIEDADYCILVAEPTAFGFHNFCMVHELASLLEKPCGVVINKEDSPYAPLMDYCREHDLPVLANFPYDSQVAAIINHGEVACLHHEETEERFQQLLERIGGAV